MFFLPVIALVAILQVSLSLSNVLSTEQNITAHKLMLMTSSGSRCKFSNFAKKKYLHFSLGETSGLPGWSFPGFSMNFLCVLCLVVSLLFVLVFCPLQVFFQDFLCFVFFRLSVCLTPTNNQTLHNTTE